MTALKFNCKDQYYLLLVDGNLSPEKGKKKNHKNDASIYYYKKYI